MITRMTAHQLREYVAGRMEPMRVAKLKQFRKTTSPVAGWKITSSAGKRGHLETITRLLIPAGSTVFVGDTDGYANQSYLYRQFRANRAVVLSNYAVNRPGREELNEIKKSGLPFEVPTYQNPDYSVQCTLSIHDPTFEYRAGETVVPRGRDFSLDEGYYGPGIHFFIDLYDALTFT